MLQRITNILEGDFKLERHVELATNSRKTAVFNGSTSGSPKVGKYEPLYHYLRMKSEKIIELTLEQIESIIGFKLPASAFKHRAWWSNDITHSQAKAWLFAEWGVVNVSLSQIMFKRIQE